MDLAVEFNKYGAEFLVMAMAHLFAVASPGPDFAIVMKHSISYGKRIAVITSLGIAVAIFVHIAYALAGIGLIIKSSPWLYQVLIAVAALFLLYIGLGAIRSKPSSDNNKADTLNDNIISDKKAFTIGFLTNGLNPKATLFFLSLFTVIVDAETPFMIKSVYGIYLAFATFVWFFVLSLLLTRPKVRRFFSDRSYIFDRIMGYALIVLAINIVYSEWIY
ncbi:MAG: LysE family transporter [Gammaproteobacteria bacterium]|nr:LysE family transporter [Gammaproteobacteria bacterium]